MTAPHKSPPSTTCISSAATRPPPVAFLFGARPSALGTIILFQPEPLLLQHGAQFRPESLFGPSRRVLQPAVRFHLARLARDGDLSSLVDTRGGHGAIVFEEGRVVGLGVLVPGEDGGRREARPDDWRGRGPA